MVRTSDLRSGQGNLNLQIGIEMAEGSVHAFVELGGSVLQDFCVLTCAPFNCDLVLLTFHTDET
jgi:hypothetical protein